MAPPLAKTTDQRGTALLEGVAVFAVLVTFAAGLMVGCYLLFARAYIEYESEQALYCLAEDNGAETCGARLQRRLERFLPWGDVGHARLSEADQTWQVEMEWNWSNYRVRTRKNLSPKIIGKHRALR